MHDMRRVARIGLAGAICALGVAAMSGAASAAASSSSFHVTSVTFSGDSGQGPSPTVTINGSGFGAAPKGTSDNSTSCGDYTANGDVFGNKLYTYDDTDGFSAGYSNKTSATCVGIVVSSWTSTKIVFTWGNAYGSYTDWWVNNGDNYVFALKGYLWGGVVSGLAT